MSNAINKVITPQNAVLGHWDGSAVTACTTRAPTATAGLAAANISVALAADANVDQRISKITVKASSSSVTAPTASQLVQVWVWDGTKAYLFDEIQIDLVTPSTTVKAFQTEKLYDDLVLPKTHALYMSTTITTTAATTAITAHVHGASM